MKILVSITLILFSIFNIQAQSLNDLFKSGRFDFNDQIDSIVTTRYIINEYADDEPDLSYLHKGKDISLHYFEKTIQVNNSELNSSEVETVHRFIGLKETLSLKFNKKAKPIYMKFEMANGEMFNEEIFYEYNKKGEPVREIKKSYNVMTYKEDNKKLLCDTTLFNANNRPNLLKRDPTSKYDSNGLKLMANTRNEIIKYEYDKNNNLIKEVKVSKSNGEFEELALHEIFYSK